MTPTPGAYGPGVEFLFGLERFGMKFGLANIARLCEALGHPERTFPSIIVAGTNGKGSVTAMVDAALRAAGHRSARYTSPHLERIEERFVVDGHEVAPEALESAALRVQRAAQDLVASGAFEAPPTFFECTTAAAFVLFRDAQVDVAILEVGLGGRLDATNVVTPVAAAIVSIDFDHQAQLGTTLASIAAEKAGVIKPGIPVVCGPLPPEAMTVIERVCREQHARLIRTDMSPDLAARVAALPLALAGRHQRANAAVAMALLEALDAAASPRLRVGADAVRTGLTTVSWPGRLERFAIGGCSILLDAAHNAAGARALAAYVREIAPDGVTLVFGAMQDKAIDEMLDALAPAAAAIVCTTAPSPRAAPAAELARRAAAPGRRVEIAEDPMSAVREACASKRMVVVAGSIFLIGPVRARLARGILR
ncbi:MAG TPA: folylpolyglutamate synthase/dihydrofolate synthase family protein [Vicinamibacterales bacterium]|nr:folylpolyglutamate synthase/dihydrofolate synthase family protein [Vicinamibacterales bacterium]